MICKAAEYKNGYIFTPNSTDEDFQTIVKEYRKSPKGFRCLIVNEETVKNFRVSLLSSSIITINKKLADGVFFINGVY